MLNRTPSPVIFASPMSSSLVSVLTICGRTPPYPFARSMSSTSTLGTTFWTSGRNARLPISGMSYTRLRTT